MDISYLAEIIILLVAAVVAVPLSQAIRIGGVPGFLIAGIIVGPYGLGLISNVSEIAHFAEIGVVFLLFVIGAELKPTLLWKIRRLVFGLGSLQVLLTGVALSSISYFVFGLSLTASVLIGPALAFSSTAFVLQILTEQKQLTSNYGRISFAVLLLQDLAVVPLLALVPLLGESGLSLSENVGLALLKTLIILLIVVGAGRYLLHPLLHRIALSGSSEVFTASAVLIVLGTAFATEEAGLSMAMGAFLAGLLISDSSYRHQMMAEIQPFRGLLLGLFFISMGMSLNIELLFDGPFLSLGLLALLLAIKVIIFAPIAYFFGVKKINSLASALVLAQSGEFALVIFTLATKYEILSNAVFQQLLLTILLSMIITPLLAQFAQYLIKLQSSEHKQHDHIDVEAPIVLAGFGRVGKHIGEILKLAEKPFVAIDFNANLVEKERSQGYPVFYGDVRSPELLRSAGAANAEIIMVTLNDPDATEKVVTALREIYPDKSLYVRGHNLNQCKELHRLGAFAVVSETIEISLELARLVLLNMGVGNRKSEAIISGYRQNFQYSIDGIENSGKGDG